MKILLHLEMEDVALYSDTVCIYIKHHLKENKIDVKLEDNWDNATKWSKIKSKTDNDIFR